MLKFLSIFFSGFALLVSCLSHCESKATNKKVLTLENKIYRIERVTACRDRFNESQVEITDRMGVVAADLLMIRRGLRRDESVNDLYSLLLDHIEDYEKAYASFKNSVGTFEDVFSCKDLGEELSDLTKEVKNFRKFNTFPEDKFENVSVETFRVFIDKLREGDSYLSEICCKKWEEN